MRCFALALIAGAALGACGNGEKSQARTDTAAAASMGAPGSTGATTAANQAGGTVAAAPATGSVHEVKMIGDERGYRFEPASLTIKQGDAVKFVMVSGGPHSVTFDSIPPAAKAQLSANIGPSQTGDLSTNMLMNADEATTVSFAKLPPGTYDFHCTPHLAMNMKGSITVQ